MKELSTLIIGAGSQGNRLGSRSNGLIINAVADPNEEVRKTFGDKFNIDPKLQFKSSQEALEKGKYDAVYVASPDKTHKEIAVLALEKGNNVLLEKPMATTAKDCIDIVEAQKQAGTVLSVCHVLRYAPFFTAIKNVIDSKELGNVYGIDITEEIANWHFPHSYVRGNWGKESESSPVILAKSCHDLDIISWLANSNIKSVTSDGSLKIFTESNAPEESKQRCTDGCKVDCLYDARKFYLGEHTKNEKGQVLWPYLAISADHSEESRLKAITEGRYGQCVYHLDNDVCDNQDVSMEFQNGVTSNFRLRSQGISPERNVKIYFERGEMEGDLIEGKLNKITYSGRREDNIVESMDLGYLGGHGGGDTLLVNNFVDMVRNPNSTQNRTSAELSLQSHLIAFAAEESRKNDSKKVFF